MKLQYTTSQAPSMQGSIANPLPDKDLVFTFNTVVFWFQPKKLSEEFQPVKPAKYWRIFTSEE